MMTTQEIFDTVATHLLTQGERSRHLSPSANPEKTMCAYRGTGGRMCAVGVLIKDKAYSPIIEGEPVKSEAMIEVLQRSDVLPMDFDWREDDRVDLLRDLQYMHDDDEPIRWKEVLNDIAYRYRLSADVLRRM